MLGITTDTNFFPPGTPIQSVITINPMFLWDFPTIRSRLGAQFLMDMGSPYGFLTAAGIGVTAVFYPLGLSSGREKREDNVEFVKTRMSPFIHVAMTPTKVSFAKENALDAKNKLKQSYFAALILETTLGIGVDYPFTDDFVAFGGIDYRFASFSAKEQGISSVSYSGPAVMLGIMTNFY